MKNFVKLTNFEWNRVARLIFILMIFTFVVQMIGVFFETSNYMWVVENLQRNEGLNYPQIIEQFGYFSFSNVTNSLLFFGPIFIGIGGILFYIFLIWYRDWFGKNTFVYRLLMLPTERINIFFAKLATIFIATLSLVAFQLIIMHIEMFVMKQQIPEELLFEMPVTYILGTDYFLSIIAPSNLDMFFILYGAGILLVSVLFTAILFERSYRLKGIVLGLGYVGMSLILMLSPILINEFILNRYFYNWELALLTIAVGLALLFLSIWMSKRLLDQKIRV